ALARALLLLQTLDRQPLTLRRSLQLERVGLAALVFALGNQTAGAELSQPLSIAFGEPRRRLRLPGRRSGFLRAGPAGDLFLSARLLLGSGLFTQGSKLRLERRKPGALLEDLQLLDAGVQLEQDVPSVHFPSHGQIGRGDPAG